MWPHPPWSTKHKSNELDVLLVSEVSTACQSGRGNLDFRPHQTLSNSDLVGFFFGGEGVLSVKCKTFCWKKTCIHTSFLGVAGLPLLRLHLLRHFYFCVFFKPFLLKTKIQSYQLETSHPNFNTNPLCSHCATELYLDHLTSAADMAPIHRGNRWQCELRIRQTNQTTATPSMFGKLTKCFLTLYRKSREHKLSVPQIIAKSSWPKMNFRNIWLLVTGNKAKSFEVCNLYSCYFVLLQEQLDLIKVAKHFSTKFAIRELGSHLGVSPYTTKAILSSVSDPQEAALDVLEEWRATMGAAEEAYKVLKKALLDAGHTDVVAQVNEKKTYFAQYSHANSHCDAAN